MIPVLPFAALRAALPALFAAAMACTPAPAMARDAGASPGEAKLPVVATFSLLADIVAQVGGDRVLVSSLVPPGGDMHVFEPGPSHARQLAQAGLVVGNGLGFEGWIDRLVRSSGYGGPVLLASRGIEPLHDAQEAGDDRHAHGGRRGKEPDHAGHPARDRDAGTQHAGGVDPHAWQSVPNMKRYVENIADGLCERQPAGCGDFRVNAGRYAARLDQLDRDIRGLLAPIPGERRKVITSHRAFGYYAREYGVTFLAPAGLGTGVEPSAAAVGRLIRQIREQKVNAFFVEGISDSRLIDRIRAETGGATSGTLYSDSLSAPEGPAASYEAMMRFNTEAITAALSAPPATPAARR